MPLQSSSNRIVCDRYRLVEVLGRGGMGVVWRAEDERLQRQVAIKEVRLPATIPSADREAAQTRALREARAAARLSHPSAVTIFDVQQDDGRAYLVMELVDAPSLAEVLEREGPLSPQRTAEIGLQVLDALETAHAAGITHRDVKPANVMVRPDGSAKLADFGIASIKDDPKITQTGLILGSPSYMAPEQAEGRGSGPKADLWALGATMYYAVEGGPPFDEGQAIPTLAAVMHDDPRPMQHAGPLAPVIGELLTKDPRDRPSHTETRRMLADVAAGRSVTPVARPAEANATAPPATYRPHPAVADDEPPPSREGKGRLVAALVGLLVLAATVAAVGWFLGRGDPEPTASGSDRSGATGEPGASGKGGAEDSSGSNSGPSSSSGPSETADTSGSAPPPGWALYEEPTTGYAIAYPETWQVDESGYGDGSSTDIEDPASGAYLRVDWTTEPGDSAVGAWREHEPNFAADHADYERIRIEPTTFQGYEAAIWEFTWEEGGTTIHAIDLGFIVEDDYGFALNFVAAESNWDELQDEFQTFQDTFEAPRS